MSCFSWFKRGAFSTSLVSLILVVSACQFPRGELTALPAAMETSPVTVEEPVTYLPLPDLPSATPSPAVEEPPTPSPSTPLGNGSRFVLPSPVPAPKSAWRPPLYEVPWALGPHDHFYFTRPIGADEVNWPLADYRYGGIFFDTDIVHTGIDIDASMKTPVIAAGAGKVIWTGYGLLTGTNNRDDPYGLAVAVRHNFGFQGERLYTVYAHMSEILVKNGQWVDAGETLGLVGDTGKTTGPHLHFEVRAGELDFFNTLNPELWLSPPQGWGVLVGRLRETGGLPLVSKDITVRSVDTGEFWVVRTYGKHAVNPDPYYQENLVLSDLPAGRYLIEVPYRGFRYTYDVEIFPGQVSYFTFQGSKLFTSDLPPTPTFEELFSPPS